MMLMIILWSGDDGELCVEVWRISNSTMRVLVAGGRLGWRRRPEDLLTKPNAIKVLHQVGVDVIGLVDQTDPCWTTSFAASFTNLRISVSESPSSSLYA